MSLFDIIISLILLGAFVRGMQKGLTIQLAALVALIVGAIFAGKAANIILPFLLKRVDISTNVAVVLSYVLAFMIIFFGVKLLGKMLHSLLEVLHINFLDKITGAALGVISASIILSILVNLAIMIDEDEVLITTNIKTESFFYSKIQGVVPIVVPYLKKEVWEKHIPEQLKKKNEEQDETIEKASSIYYKKKQLKI